MHARGSVRRWLAGVAVAATFVGVSTPDGSAAAAWQQVATQSPASVHNEFDGVAAVSATRAWAVGYADDGATIETLIERWNGTGWKRVASPNPGGPSSSGHDDNLLYGVSGTSPSDAWAVGEYNNGSDYSTLIEHWDGSAWALTTSPDPGGSSHQNTLNGVDALSTSRAWAVGTYSNGSQGLSLIERWNGTAWKHVSAPSPSSTENFLEDVTATSGSNAWAVGYVNSGTGYQTYILRWNGTAWKRQKSPDPGGSQADNELWGVTATSKSDAWAVGYYGNGSRDVPLILHWNGTKWKVVPSPTPGTSNDHLFDVTALSATAAWAVGSVGSSTKTFVVRWNGTAWQRVSTPSPGDTADELYGTAATSATDVWAVGFDASSGSADQTLALHCC